MKNKVSISVMTSKGLKRSEVFSSSNSDGYFINSDGETINCKDFAHVYSHLCSFFKELRNLPNVSFRKNNLFEKNNLSSDSLRLYDAVVAFDELSNANIYHVSITHKFACSQDAISVFFLSVKFLSDCWTISLVGDTCTRFLVVSYLSPCYFEKFVRDSFNKHKSSSLFNIIF